MKEREQTRVLIKAFPLEYATFLRWFSDTDMDVSDDARVDGFRIHAAGRDFGYEEGCDQIEKEHEGTYNEAVRDCTIWMLQFYGEYKPEYLAEYMLRDVRKVSTPK